MFSLGPLNFGSRALLLCLVQGGLLLGLYSLRLITNVWLASSYLLLLGSLSLWLAAAACVAFDRERTGLGLVAAVFAAPGLLYLAALLVGLLN